MITASLLYIDLYKAIHPNLAKAIAFIKNTDFNSLQPDRYEIDGDNAFVIINEYETKPPATCEPESHRTYTDIQLMITGMEQFGYAQLNNHIASTPYMPDKDVAFYTLKEEELNYNILHPGEFIIFFPTDIHQPEVMVGQPARVKKAVVKVKI
jgi:biofilm protein TabA